MFVSVVIITRDRLSDLQNCLKSIKEQSYVKIEVVIVDNSQRSETENYFLLFNDEKIKYYRMNENLGVSGGRNFGISKSIGDVIVTVDDDAYFKDKNAINKIVEKFEVSPSIGVIAFKIIDHYSNIVEPMFFPSRNKKRSVNEEFETTWFIGAGHAIHRNVYEKVGIYRNFWPYGSEEFDLSLRIIDNNERIVYSPEIEIFHKEVKTSRLPSDEIIVLRLKHRIKAAYFNLPPLNIFTFFIIRSIHFLIKYKRLSLIFEAWKQIFAEIDGWKKHRKQISKLAIKKIKQLNGHVYF